MNDFVIGECPICAAKIDDHTPGSKTDFEAWVFNCGAELLRLDSGRIIAETSCPNAMKEALAALNLRARAALTEHPRTGGQP